MIYIYYYNDIISIIKMISLIKTIESVTVSRTYDIY